MKQNLQAFTQVRMPSKRTSVNSMPQSCPGSRTSSTSTGSPSPSPGSSTTSRTATGPSASQRQAMRSVSGTPFTLSMRMPGSIPTSQAGLPSSTLSTNAPMARSRVEA